MRSSAIKGSSRYLLFGLLALLGWSCHQNENSPGVEFMPDMYRSPAIEAYMDYRYPDSLLAMKPVEGTIPFDAEYAGDSSFNPNFPYPYPDNTEGYEKAGEELKNPLELTPERLEKGEQIYTDYCEHCHGSEGKGDGPVIESGHAPPPSFTQQLSDLPEGKAFHSIKYGKGLMGSHSSQLSKKERWLVVHYVQVLQNGGADPFKTDTASAEADTSSTATGNEEG